MKQDLRNRSLEAAVIGVPNETWGEVVVAYVQPSPGATPVDDVLKAVCSERLSGYKRPVEYVFVDALPKNAVGKIDKVSIRAAHAARTQTRLR